MGWGVNATPQPLHPLERDPVPIVQEDVRGRRTSLDGYRKFRPRKDSFPRPSIPQQVAIPTTISRSTKRLYLIIIIIIIMIIIIIIIYCNNDFNGKYRAIVRPKLP
jgi:hypothetical protein